jgi:hypothetical protein
MKHGIGRVKKSLLYRSTAAEKKERLAKSDRFQKVLEEGLARARARATGDDVKAQDRVVPVVVQKETE